MRARAHLHAHTCTQAHAVSRHVRIPICDTVLLPAFVMGADNFAWHKLQCPTEKAGVFLSVCQRLFITDELI